MLRITSRLLPLGLALAGSAYAVNSFANDNSNDFANESATSGFVGGVRYGDRYIVKYRSLSTFRALEAKLLGANKIFSKDAFGNSVQAQTLVPGTSSAVIEKALPAFQMMIIDGNAADMDTLRANPEVAYVEREMYFPAPPTLTYNNDQDSDDTSADLIRRKKKKKVTTAELTWGLNAIKAPAAWALKTDTAPGTGVKVMVLDTGIDRDHPELKNRFAEGKDLISKKAAMDDSGPAPDDSFLLSGLRSLVGAEFKRTTTTLPYPYFDSVGHGTHVSGTIAAELDGKGVVGIAYGAKIYAGRVCGKFGCSTTALIDGIHWAQQVGADVINMSLGGPLSSPAQADAMAQISAQGIIPVAAAGNDGSDKLGYPAAYPKVISVGAIDENLKRTSFSQWGPSLVITAPGNNILSSVPLGTGRASIVKIKLGAAYVEVPSATFVGSSMPASPLVSDLVYAKLGKPDDFVGVDVHGKTALIERGEILFADKTKNALAAGAIGVLIYNNEPGLISGAITEDGSEVGVPIAMVEQTIGESIVKTLAGGATVSSNVDIAKTDYAAFMGTSMACPHIVGVVALLRWANPKITAAQVSNVLTSTTQKPNDTDANIGQNQYGAGIVDAAAAVKKAMSL